MELQTSRDHIDRRTRGKCREIRHSAQPTADATVQEPTSLESLLTEVRLNPFQGLKRCAAGWKDNNDGHRARQYELFAVLCAYTKRILKDADELAKLRESDFWNETPRVPGQKKPAILAARYMLGVKGVADGNMYEMAREYSKAVEHFVEMNVDPAQVPAALKAAGGIYAVADAAAGRPAKPKKGKADETVLEVDDQSLDEDEQVVAPDDDDEEDLMPKKGTSKRANAGVKAEGVGNVMHRPRFDPDRHIIFEGGIYQDEIRGTSHKKRLWVLLEFSQLDSGWKDIKAIETKPA